MRFQWDFASWKQLIEICMHFNEMSSFHSYSNFSSHRSISIMNQTFSKHKWHQLPWISYIIAQLLIGFSIEICIPVSWIYSMCEFVKRERASDMNFNYANVLHYYSVLISIINSECCCNGAFVFINENIKSWAIFKCLLACYCRWHLSPLF